MNAGKDKSLESLFFETLKDAYYTERQILKMLPRMIDGTHSPELKSMFEMHQGQTERQVTRLEQVFRLIGKRPQGVTCAGINGLLDDTRKMFSEFEGSDVLDMALLSSALAIEHYEIVRYGSLKAWAKQLGMKEVVVLLDQTLREEKETDRMLSGLADAEIVSKAA